MKIAIFGNPGKETIIEAVNNFTNLLFKRKIDFVISEDLRFVLSSLNLHSELFVDKLSLVDSNVIFTFGGDGTMLSAGRLFAGYDIPIVGINLGRLGFLAEFSLESLDITIDEFLAGTYKTVKRTLLSARFPGLNETENLIALNDIVIDKREEALMLQIETYINGDYIGVYNSDGLIIATPTGSTAYSLAVGGPVIEPSSKVFVIAPIAPHMLTARPLVVSDNSLLSIKVVNSKSVGSISVYADGQEKRTIRFGDEILINKYEKSVYLVKSPQVTYWDVLRAKLLWGREPILNRI